MPAIVTFDPSGPLRIIEISAGGDNELDWIEIYSEWKVWSTLPGNMKYPPAFRVVGGDPISDIQDLGSTFFLLAPWKFRPAELSHRLLLNGNAFTDPAGESPIVPTLGSYTVLVESFVSNLVDASVARLDLTQLLPAVFIDVDDGVAGTDEGIGTPTNPVNNLVDAFTIATRDSLREFRFRGNLTLDRDTTGWTWFGQGSSTQAVLDLNGYDVDGSRFQGCTLTGTMQGRIEAVEVKLDVILGLDGVFRRSGLVSSFSTADGSTIVLQDCISELPGTGAPACDVGANCNLSIRNYSGGLELQNVALGTTCSVDLDPGHLVLGPTNTGGVVVVRGMAQITDTSQGTTVVKDGLIENATLLTIQALAATAAAEATSSRRALLNRMEIDFTSQELIIWGDDEVTPLYRQDLATDGGELVTAVRGIQTKRSAPK